MSLAIDRLKGAGDAYYYDIHFTPFITPEGSQIRVSSNNPGYTTDSIISTTGYYNMSFSSNSSEYSYFNSFSTYRGRVIVLGDKIHFFDSTTSKHLTIEFDISSTGEVMHNQHTVTCYDAPTTPTGSAMSLENSHLVVYNNHIRAIFRDKYLDYDDATNTWTQSVRSGVGTGTDADFAKQYVFMDSLGREHQVGTFAESNNYTAYDYVYNPSTGYNNVLFAQLPINNNFAAVGESNGSFYYMGGTTTYGGTTASNRCYRLPITAKENSYYSPNEFENSLKLYTLTKEAIS